jgi:hypothetical protein
LNELAHALLLQASCLRHPRNAFRPLMRLSGFTFSSCSLRRRATRSRRPRAARLGALLLAPAIALAAYQPLAHAQEAESGGGSQTSSAPGNPANPASNPAASSPSLLDMFNGAAAPGQLSAPGQIGGAGQFGALGHSAFYGQPTGNSLDVVLGDTLLHDSNLFRFPEALGPQMDTVNSSYLGLRANKVWSQQTFQFNITQTRNRYDRFSYLDNESLDYHVVWLWSLTSRFTGTLHDDYNESLAPFENGTSVQRDETVLRSRGLTSDAWLFGGWHLIFNATHSSQQSTQFQQATPDFLTNTTEFGVNYVLASNSSVTATRRLTDGQYVGLPPSTGPSLTGSGFHRIEYKLKASLILSPRSTLTPSISWLTHKQQDSPLYDISGPEASIAYLWTATDKLNVQAEAGHTLYSFTDPLYNREFTQYVKITPTWLVGPKTAVHVTLQGTRYSYGTLPGATPIGPERRESAATAELGAVWMPLGFLSLAASVNHSQRNVTNSSLFPFVDTMARLTASLTF